MRSGVLVVIGFIMLIAFVVIGFFALPIGITLCAIIGLCYGFLKSDKLFIRWSAVALLIGVILVVYSFSLISSM